jgi:hypothetical protein
MTREDIISNLEFKAVIKSIRNKYPFIVGYELPEDFEDKWVEYTSILPVRYIVSLGKVKEMFPDWEPMFYVPTFMKQDGYYDGIYLSNAFNTNDNEEPRNVEKDFENISERVRRSSVIPREKKIGRAIVPSKFRFIP